MLDYLVPDCEILGGFPYPGSESSLRAPLHTAPDKSGSETTNNLLLFPFSTTRCNNL